MSNINFSVANTSYLITALNLIDEDPIRAKHILGVDNDTIQTLKNLTPEEVQMLGSIQTPFMEMRLDTHILADLKDACESQLVSKIKKVNDRILLKAC